MLFYHSDQKNQVDSPLLRLPAELRNRIYDLALDPDSKNVRHYDHYDWDRLNPSRTCRQIFTDTAAQHYNINILPLQEGLKFFTLAALRKTTPVLTPSQKEPVVKIRWKRETQCTTRTGSECPLDALPNLREVVLVYETVHDSDSKSLSSYEHEDTRIL
jgi:hypothetical protein